MPFPMSDASRAHEYAGLDDALWSIVPRRSRPAGRQANPPKGTRPESAGRATREPSMMEMSNPAGTTQHHARRKGAGEVPCGVCALSSRTLRAASFWQNAYESSACAGGLDPPATRRPREGAPLAREVLAARALGPAGQKLNLEEGGSLKYHIEFRFPDSSIGRASGC